MTQTSSNTVFRAARVVAFAALAFLLSGCGEGSQQGSRLDNTLSSNSSESQQSVGQNQNTDSSAGNDQAEAPEQTAPEADNETVVEESPITEEEPVAEEPVTDDEPVAGNEEDQEKESGVDTNGYVKLMWERPSLRENGEHLYFEDIGGYELRYQAVDADTYKVRELGPEADETVFEDLEGKYTFTIAVFDADGLYSRFVDITPQY